MKWLLTSLVFLLLAAPASANNVEARSLAVSGHTLYVGTSAGTIWSSTDDGITWQGFAKFREDYVIDRMLVDGDHFYVAAWTLGDPDKGSFFASADGGNTWNLTLAKPVRAIGISNGVLVVGALDGVYRSRDYGMTFDPISKDIKDIQSIAIDPNNPSFIFIGTWHLGYYTHNAGVTWHSIAKGLINDSDFFSILLDKTDSSTIYIGACSGIYKGSDDGEQYKKLKTIKDARRTKVLYQVSKEVIYAGTTDGIFLTTNGGASWRRQSSKEIVVNDLVVLGKEYLIIASSKLGLIFSEDGGKTLRASAFLPSPSPTQ